MTRPELLADYAKTFRTFVALLPAQQTFPCVVTLGLRDNQAGRPRGIEADFLQFVASARESSPSEATAWPPGSIPADGLRYDGERLGVSSGADEFCFVIDRNCPMTLYSFTASPDDFERLVDAEMLASYVNDRPHSSAPLALQMRASQMHTTRERPPASSARQREAPMYERPTQLKTIGWLILGILLVLIGAKWLGAGMKQGIAVNFYGWAVVVLGAVLIVRRGLDLLFPPSRL